MASAERGKVKEEAPAAASTRRVPVLALVIGAVLLCGGLVAAYANHFDNGFYFDDQHTILTNASIRSLEKPWRFFTDATTSSSLPANQVYRPVVTLLNAIDYRLSGAGSDGNIDPRAFHISIFTWYLVQLLLLYFVFRKLLDTADPDGPRAWNAVVALLATGFYGLHTANAETINYIIARSDGFSTLCVVAALLLYQVPATRRLLLYLVPMIIGLYTKPTAAMFCLLLLLYIALFEEKVTLQPPYRDNLARMGRSLLKAAPATIVTVVIVYHALAFMTPEHTLSTNTEISRIDYLRTQTWVVTHYVGNFFVPLRLHADIHVEPVASWGDNRALLGLAVIVCSLVLAAMCAGSMRTRPVTFGIAWFYVALAPTSSLAPLYEMANDHRTFFPFIGLALALFWAAALGVRWVCDRLPASRAWLPHAAGGVAVVVIATHAWGVHQRNEVWDSAERLWHEVTLKSPRNGRGHMNYGLALMDAQRYDEARVSFERSLAILPAYSYLYINLGLLEEKTGRPQRAEPHFQHALRLDPRNPEAYVYYAGWLWRNGRPEEAWSIVERGLTVSPNESRLVEMRDALPAGSNPLPTLEQTAEQTNKADDWLALSLAYHDSGRYRECIEACERAIEVRPDYAEAYNNICSAWIELGDYGKAIDACTKALEINPNLEHAQNNLTVARQRQ